MLEKEKAQLISHYGQKTFLNVTKNGLLNIHCFCLKKVSHPDE